MAGLGREGARFGTATRALLRDRRQHGGARDGAANVVRPVALIHHEPVGSVARFDAYRKGGGR
jgi:hypothetical protein